MRCVYPVFFTISNDYILVEVPDLDILTQGNDMNNAIDMARDAIELKCISMEDANETIPAPSDISSLNTVNGAFSAEGETVVSFVDIDTAEYLRKIEKRM